MCVVKKSYYAILMWWDYIEFLGSYLILGN